MDYKKIIQTAGFTLTERILFRKIISNQGTLFLQGPPGMGKTSIVSSIAKKSGMKLLGIPVAAYENVDLSGFPITKKINGIDAFFHAKPVWAFQANEHPTIVFFDEANRASRDVQNALMKIIHEKSIDADFSFNENVFFVIAGNTGSYGDNTDGTDINDFDSAFYNRLIKHEFHPTLDEWINDFAKEKVNPYFISFLKINANFYYNFDESNQIYCTPRSWTRLSNHIKYWSNTDSINDILSLSDDFASYIGVKASLKLIDYLTDLNQLTFDDILNDFDGNITKIETLSRPQIKGFANMITQEIFNKLSEKQVLNFVRFLELCELDEQVAVFFNIAPYLNKENVKKLKNRLPENIMDNVKTAFNL